MLVIRVGDLLRAGVEFAKSRFRGIGRSCYAGSQIADISTIANVLVVNLKILFANPLPVLLRLFDVLSGIKQPDVGLDLTPRWYVGLFDECWDVGQVDAVGAVLLFGQGLLADAARDPVQSVIAAQVRLDGELGVPDGQ